MEPVTTTIRTVRPAAELEAFVDGALSPEAAAQLVLHLADCPGDRAYVDAMMEMNALLAAAYGDPMHQAVPDRLRATIYPAVSVAPPRTAARPDRSPAVRRPRRAAWAALAASVAVAIGVAAGLAPRDPATAPLAGLDGADAALHAALEASPGFAEVATPEGERIMIIATFLAADGRPCREFEVIDAAARTQGLACREDGGWTPEIAVASRLATAEPRQDFVPAEGEGGDALDAAYQRLAAGPPLTPEQERELIAAGWAN